MPIKKATKLVTSTKARAVTRTKKKTIHSHADKFALKHTELRWRCDEKQFTFRNTGELDPLNGIVGQHRAIEAITLGAEIGSRGFNIFVMSLLGTGRLTTIKQVLERVAKRYNQYNDYAYVNNFKNPDMPRLLKFPQGEARKFAKAMEENISVLRRRIPQLFEEENFRKTRNALIAEYQHLESSILEEFDAQIRPAGFALGTLQQEDGTTTQEIFPVINDEPVQITELENLVSSKKITKKKADELVKAYQQLRGELFNVGRRSMQLAQEFRRALNEHDRAASGLIVRTVLNDERLQYDNPSVHEYLSECESDLLMNIEIFSPAHSDESVDSELTNGQRLSEKLLQYSVNVVLDNAGRNSAPIEIETTPTFVNLFGTVEKKYDKNGFVKTDFTMIKPGALLRADGGYLVVNASDILADATVWQTLKRVLLYGRLEMQSADGTSVIGASLKPASIESNVKIIMLGDYETYVALHQLEEDFGKMFKIAAEFDYETDRADKMLSNYARFIAKICNEEAIPHADRSGVSAIVEWGVEQTEDKNKLSINFSNIADLIRESAFYAKQVKSKLIKRIHVERALAMRRRRTELQDVKTKSQILQGTLLIDTQGERVGQINGLTVYSTGLVSFGQPARITATTGAGNRGIVNIERESDFSGNIHTKGVLIISGLLRMQFAQRRPLALSTSISFEQSYGGVDGDSASAAELFAILSSLARVPIRQDIAVTGSINQLGDIQAVGGVNEKIKGYFDICQGRGLTGTQGVIIPSANAADLMLDYSIVQAVKEKKFHIYSINRMEEGIKILFGMDCGTMDEFYTYPQGTLFNLVDKRLDELYQTAWRGKLEM